jgi:hypothetical protein
MSGAQCREWSKGSRILYKTHINLYKVCVHVQSPCTKFVYKVRVQSSSLYKKFLYKKSLYNGDYELDFSKNTKNFRAPSARNPCILYWVQFFLVYFVHCTKSCTKSEKTPTFFARLRRETPLFLYLSQGLGLASRSDLVGA